MKLLRFINVVVTITIDVCIIDYAAAFEEAALQSSSRAFETTTFRQIWRKVQAKG
jgi:hypothetical protein